MEAALAAAAGAAVLAAEVEANEGAELDCASGECVRLPEGGRLSVFVDATIAPADDSDGLIIGANSDVEDEGGVMEDIESAASFLSDTSSSAVSPPALCELPLLLLL